MLDPSPESIKQRLGQTIGARWKLEHVLGSGTTAAVYQASDATGQRAALKVLFPHMAANEEVRRRFGQEARVISTLSHPGIVGILDHDVVRTEDAYIAFEFLDGETLAQRAERDTIMVSELLEVAEQLLDALAVAHEQGIVHRDLKPSNIFLTSDGRAKILDFGVARMMADDATAIGTQYGLAIGTVAYMAPEQALGKHDAIDGRTDLFSLGAVLFRLLAGEAIHPAKTITDALQKTATEPVRSLGTVRSDLPPELVAIVDLSLAFSQASRYANARAMQEDLRAYRSGAPASVASRVHASREEATVVPSSRAASSGVGVAPTLLALQANPAQVVSASSVHTELDLTGGPAGPASSAVSEPPPSQELLEARALLGQVVAERYRLDAVLGTGGMGAVYRAEHVHMKKNVALKVLHRSMTVKPEVVARFEREAVAAARIDHPHVAGAKDFGRLEGGSFYLALEYVQGVSLRRQLRSEGKLGFERARTIAMQIASALSAAHRLGIVHRDLKPENIMLLQTRDESDFVKVLDFGIAKLTRDETASDPQLTQLGTVFGTPQYMSPEQAMGSPVDAKTDVYSLGIILYELLTGTTPFAGSEMMVVLTAHMTQAPNPLPATVPRPLAQLTMDLLQKTPAERPSSEQVMERLSELSTLVAPARGAVARQVLEQTWLALRLRGQGLASELERRLHAAGLRLPLWQVLAVGGGSLLVGVVLVLAIAGGDDPEPVEEKAISSAAIEVRPRPAPRPPAKEVSPQTQRELARIRALPVYKRNYEDWLSLARLSADLGEYKESTLAYQAVLSLKGSMRTDARLLKDLERAAWDEASFDLVVNLSATRLKQPGLDLLWQLWQAFRKDPARSEQSELLSKKLVVLSRRASRELRTAIELGATQNCDKLKKTVTRAAKYSDQRAVEGLNALLKRDGCGPKQAHDCYPCLREDNALARALSHARERPAPQW